MCVFAVSSFTTVVVQRCRVQHLSLRYNGITDVGAERLGQALGTTNKQNSRLLSLNLTGNRLTDAGAGHIAQVRDAEKGTTDVCAVST